MAKDCKCSQCHRLGVQILDILFLFGGLIIVCLIKILLQVLFVQNISWMILVLVLNLKMECSLWRALPMVVMDVAIF